MSKTRKIVMMIISLIVSVLLWGYVVTYVNPVIDVSISGIPIQILNADTLEARGFILTNVSNTTTAVTVSGSRLDVADIDADDILATLDVANYGEGENAIRLNISAPSNVTVKEIKNNGRVTATIEQLVSEEKPYEFLYGGTIPQGYEMGFLTLKPEAVKVSGAKSLVDSVETLRVILDLNNVSKEGYHFESAIAPTSADSKEVGGVSLSAQKLTGTAYLCEVVEIGLNILVDGDLPEGMAVTSDNYPYVRVRTYTDVFDTVELLDTEPVPAAALSENPADILLTPVLPEGVEYASNGGPVTAKLYLIPAEEPENPEEPSEEESSETQN